MTDEEMSAIYRAYLACLNRREWMNLGDFVDEKVIHNDRPLGLGGYREMLVQDVSRIPDLCFEIDMLVTHQPFIAVRLRFDCIPIANFLDLPVKGQRIQFCENVFYRFVNGRIAQVWSIIDKVAIESQI